MIKNLRYIVTVASLVFLLSSCRIWNHLFPTKYGCGTNGKNIGAEKLASGDPKADKQARKAKKFKS